MRAPSSPSRSERAYAGGARAALFCLVLEPTLSGKLRAEEYYTLSFSTYLGGSNWEHARDVVADRVGNVYMVGGTASGDFPVTAGAYQTTQNMTGTHVGSGGYCDGFVAKFGPTGRLIWCSYLGGPNYDRVYGVEVDDAGRSACLGDDGSLYVTGASDGSGWPVKNAHQPAFAGGGGGYGNGDCILAKFVPPHPALRFHSLEVSGNTVALVLTNLTEAIPYVVQRTDGLATAGVWSNVHSFTASGPTASWGEEVTGRSAAFYRAKSGQ